MELQMDTIRARLREVFGTDSQETVAKKLNMTQGTISKILSGNQQPTLETIYNISMVYDVSVDWIVGLSDKKQISKYNDETTYALAVESLTDMINCGAADVKKDSNGEYLVGISDVLMKALLRKSIALSQADRDIFQNWVDTKLSLFEGRPLIWKSTWDNETMFILGSEAATESNWIEVHDEAMKLQDEYIEIMNNEMSIFKGDNNR